ncbi:MAG: hypothetical protein ACOVRN_04110 [Flavobacterium sp.]
MYQDDHYHPADQNDYDDTDELLRMLSEQKRADKGYNVVYRKAWRTRKNRRTGQLENKYVREKIELYSSDGFGSYIRDAESGEYFPNHVGTKDEDLFFKVILATGECTSKNGSKTFFFMSPQNYEHYMNSEVDPLLVSQWDRRRDARLAEIGLSKKANYNMVDVK